MTSCISTEVTQAGFGVLAHMCEEHEDEVSAACLVTIFCCFPSSMLNNPGDFQGERPQWNTITNCAN